MTEVKESEFQKIEVDKVIELANGSVRIDKISVFLNIMPLVAENPGLVIVKHDGTAEICTDDIGFEEAITELVGFKVTFSGLESFMQEDGLAILNQCKGMDWQYSATSPYYQA